MHDELATPNPFVLGEDLFRRLAPEGAQPPWDALAPIAPVLGAQAKYMLGAILQRPALDLRTRQIATICILAALGSCEPQLSFHIGGALRVGVAPAEVIEALTQIGVYAGLPRAINAVSVARRVFTEEGVSEGLAAPRAVVIAFLDSRSRGDLRTALSLLDEDVVWSVSGQREVVPWTGIWSGREAVSAFMAVVTDEVELESLVLEEPLAVGELVYVAGSFAERYPCRATAHSGDLIMQFRVRDRNIVHCRVHLDSLALAKAYTGSGDPGSP